MFLVDVRKMKQNQPLYMIVHMTLVVKTSWNCPFPNSTN